MRILGIIPARGGSKGIPGKNIKILNGVPLIVHTYNSAKESKLLTRCIVSTDDQEIAKVCKEYGMDVPFSRPSSLADDKAPTLPLIIHALKFLEDLGEVFDAVCLLQPTNPFRKTGFVDEAIKKFEESGADALVSVLPVPHEFNPHWTFKNNKEGFLNISTGEKEIIPRRQDLPIAYFRDGAIYLTKTEVILKMNSLYGDKLAFIVNDENRHINLDNMLDWDKAVALSKKIS